MQCLFSWERSLVLTVSSQLHNYFLGNHCVSLTAEQPVSKHCCPNSNVLFALIRSRLDVILWHSMDGVLFLSFRRRI